MVNIKLVQMKDQHLFGCLQVETKKGELKLVHDIMVQFDKTKLSMDFFNGNLFSVFLFARHIIYSNLLYRSETHTNHDNGSLSE